MTYVGMYESVRMYALEKLASASQEVVRQSHAAYFLKQGEAAASVIHS